MLSIAARETKGFYIKNSSYFFTLKQNENVIIMHKENYLAIGFCYILSYYN